MTTATLDEPYTVRTLLLGAERPVDLLAGSLHDRGAVGTLAGITEPVGRAAEHEVAGVVNGFLGLDLIDLAAGGWSRYAGLRDAARRTRDAPAAEEVVAMATHRIKSRHRPSVEVFVDGASVGTLQVQLDLVFELAGLVAVVRLARLTAVRAGTCTVTGTLAVERITVAQRQRQLDLPGAVRLRQGVPLLPADEQTHDPTVSADLPRQEPGDPSPRGRKR